MNTNGQLLIFVLVIYQLVYYAQCSSHGEDAQVDSALKRLLVRSQPCPDANMCLSQWGYCGYGSAYCGQGCLAGPCIGVGSTPKPQPSGCFNPYACLSQWGFCGFGPEYCGQGCQGGPCIGAAITTPKPQPSGCFDPYACLSQWGFCGFGPEYCGQGCRGGPCMGATTTTSATTRTTTPGTTTTTSQSQPLPCPDLNACLSQHGYCGYGAEYCGQGCKGGPCTGNGGNSSGGNNGDIINDQNFACAFNGLDAYTRAQRLDGLRRSGYKPNNTDEAAAFLAHVFHETAGLSTLTEYCAPGCGPNYAESWCDIEGVPGKLYYGRGWFQLSYPCNYYAAGQALGLDLLNNPDMIAQDQDVAVKTAVWFFQANNMVEPARRGDFAATTRIINGPRECNGGPGTGSQYTRVATYRRIRQCFGLGEPTINPMC